MTKSEQAKYDTVVAQRNDALNTLAQQNGFIADLQAQIAELKAIQSAAEVSRDPVSSQPRETGVSDSDQTQAQPQ